MTYKPKDHITWYYNCKNCSRCNKREIWGGNKDFSNGDKVQVLCNWNRETLKNSGTVKLKGLDYEQSQFLKYLLFPIVLLIWMIIISYSLLHFCVTTDHLLFCNTFFNINYSSVFQLFNWIDFDTRNLFFVLLRWYIKYITYSHDNLTSLFLIEDQIVKLVDNWCFPDIAKTVSFCCKIANSYCL